MTFLFQVKCDLKVSKLHLYREANFKDVESDDKKDLNVSIQPFESNFNTKMVEIETAVQAAPFQSDSCSQTIWRYPKNAATQYEPRFMDSKQCQDILEQEDLNNFVKNLIPE